MKRADLILSFWSNVHPTLGPPPFSGLEKRQHSDATFAFQLIFEYLKKNKGCNYSLCHVLNCHVDVDPKHVVCDEANEDKNGNMNPPNQMLCDMLLIIMAFRRILKKQAVSKSWQYQNCHFGVLSDKKCKKVEKILGFLRTKPKAH